jgi:hypothetical protein
MLQDSLVLVFVKVVFAGIFLQTHLKEKQFPIYFNVRIIAAKYGASSPSATKDPVRPATKSLY